jgi:hypothetical protein
MKVDQDNLPVYMRECITEDFDDCGLFVDRITGEIHDIKIFKNYRVNVEKFKEKFIMISRDF